MSLESLAAKYGTDKLQHGYIPFYERHLPKEPKRILEIGVKEGKSLAMWAEYFPNAEIHGLDLFEENNVNNVLDFLSTGYHSPFDVIDKFKLHKGNQCDWRMLEELRKLDFDVIIDDGSHNSRDQMITFFGLFNGKQYFIEDLHCNEQDFYSQGLPPDYNATNIFGVICDNNDGTDYHNDVLFGEVPMFDPYKIVCIKAS